MMSAIGTAPHCFLAGRSTTRFSSSQVLAIALGFSTYMTSITLQSTLRHEMPSAGQPDGGVPRLYSGPHRVPKQVSGTWCARRLERGGAWIPRTFKLHY